MTREKACGKYSPRAFNAPNPSKAKTFPNPRKRALMSFAVIAGVRPDT